MRSLGLATDLLALGERAVIERRPDRIVVRTPDEPTFWSGNMLIRLTPPEAPEREAAAFREAFPEASHLRIAWDDPDLDPEALSGPWAAVGAEVEVDDVLARQGPPPPVPSPEGYALRALGVSSDGASIDMDWEGWLAVTLASGLDEGFKEATHLPFLRRRAHARRVRVETGRERWWGAFAVGPGRREGPLVAKMGLVEGIVDGRPLARFQDVDTHPDHRRRGLCAALLAHVGAAAVARAGGAAPGPTLVIVAEAGGAPGRLYRRAGFAPVERMVAVQRRGY